MRRLAEISIDQMTQEQRGVYEKIRPGRTGTVQGPAGAWLLSPSLFERFEEMVTYLRHESRIPSRLLELAILFTVNAWGAAYPRAAHEPLARKAKLGEDVIAALAAGTRPAFTNTDEEATYNFCVELSERHSVEESTYQAALAHLGEQGLVELVAALGLYTAVSMTVNAFEIPVVT